MPSNYQLTTAPITLDSVAAAVISSALHDKVDNLEYRLRRAKSAKTIERVENELANTRRALAAFEPVYTAVLAAPMFTPEYQALLDRTAK